MSAIHTHIGSRYPGTRYAAESAVVSIDMSGFTRTTRRHGIVHFASLILQMRRLAARVFAHYHARTWTTEADNCFAVFPRPELAVLAALECKEIAHRFNATVPDESFHLKIGGIGVDCGAEIIQDPHSRKLVGTSVNWSYYLGEEIADNAEILISQATRTRLESSPLGRYLKLTPRRFQSQTYYVVSSQLRPRNVPLPKDNAVSAQSGQRTADGTPFFQSILQRAYASNSQREAIDQQLKNKHLRDGVTVMVGADLTEMCSRHGPARTIECTRRIVQIIHPVVKQHDGCAVEEFLFLFNDSLQAFEASQRIRELIGEFNDAANADQQLNVTGIAAHTGRLLMVPGTDVHWGDPVNTASKLAQDVASDGELYVSEPIYRRVQGSVQRHRHSFQPQSVTVSRVDLECFEVD